MLSKHLSLPANVVDDDDDDDKEEQDKLANIPSLLNQISLLATIGVYIPALVLAPIQVTPDNLTDFSLSFSYSSLQETEEVHTMLTPCISAA